MMETKRIKGGLVQVLLYVLFAIVCVVNLYPVFWVVASSFKTNQEFLVSLLALPTRFEFTNYVKAWQESRIGVYFFNSLYVAILSIVVILFLAVMVSYALARYSFKLRNTIYAFFLIGMLIPVHSTLVPIFVTFSSLGLANKWFTLILPYVGFNMPFAIFILESFIRTVPIQIEEAAVIDGCSKPAILARIVFPLCGPAVATVCVMTFFNIWNDFIFPLILVTDNNLKTVQLGLQNFIGPRSANYPQMMAALTIAIIPVLVTYFVFQKSLIQGMSAGAVKG